MPASENPGLNPAAHGMTAAPLLSVIIVTYQSRDDIGACLASIPREVHGLPVEVVVVDNDSRDGTLELVRRDFPHVRAMSSGANLGFSKANNLGYGATIGEYILFLNPDTVVTRVALEHCLDRLRADPGIGIISPKLVLGDGGMDLACRRSVPTVWDGLTRASGLARLFPKSRLCAGYNLTFLPEDGTYSVGAVNGAFMMIPRRVLTRIGLFDEQFFMYGDDLDLCLRCSLEGFKVVYDGRHSITHYKGRSSSKEYRTMSRAVFKGTKQFYLKHFNRHNSLLTRWKYEVLFWLWSSFAATVAALKRHKSARPV